MEVRVGTFTDNMGKSHRHRLRGRSQAQGSMNLAQILPSSWQVSRSNGKSLDRFGYLWGLPGPTSGKVAWTELWDLHLRVHICLLGAALLIHGGTSAQAPLKTVTIMLIAYGVLGFLHTALVSDNPSHNPPFLSPVPNILPFLDVTCVLPSYPFYLRYTNIDFHTAFSYILHVGWPFSSLSIPHSHHSRPVSTLLPLVFPFLLKGQREIKLELTMKLSPWGSGSAQRYYTGY